MTHFAILGGQTTDGLLGAMLALDKVIAGYFSVGLDGQEGEVLKRALVCGAVITGAMGVRV